MWKAPFINRLVSFAGHFLFWLVFFAISRLVFLMYNLPLPDGAGFSEVMATFYHAFRLDLSTVCYLMAFPLLLYMLQSFRDLRLFRIIRNIYTGLIIFLYSGIVAAEAGVYQEWQTKLHFKALLYLQQPGEMVNTAGTGRFVALMAIWLGLTIGSFLLYYYVFRRRKVVKERSIPAFLVFLLLILPSMGIGIRGGLQQIPINQSDAYFSQHEILNLAAVNPGYNLLHSVVQNYAAMGENPFVFYPREEALAVLDSIIKPSSGPGIMVLSGKRPNIMLFILEGWSADVMEASGGDRNIAPFLNRLADSSLTFVQTYGSGTRSQQGMAAIFSAYPAVPYATITQQPEKYTKLPSLNRDLETAGYSSAFYFGGQLTYGNLKSYMMYQGFDRIVEEADLPEHLERGKLGVHDGDLLPVVLKDLDKQSEPFFVPVFTLSTHTPYDHPAYRALSGYSDEKEYLNSVHYADHCIEEFMKQAAEKPWYSNTLFVFISDHSHGTHKNHPMFSREYSRIIWMFSGEVLKSEFRGRKHQGPVSQSDLPSTLLPQLGLSATDYHWGKNVLDPRSPEWAFYSFEVGLGWIRPCGHYVHEFRVEQDYALQVDSGCIYTPEQLRREGNAFLQILYDDFLAK